MGFIGTVSRDIVFFLRAELFKSVLSVSALKAPDFFFCLDVKLFEVKIFSYYFENTY
jgi:hypothetical protein